LSPDVTSRKPTDAPRRIFIYSHDTYGLGHLRRCTAIAESLLRAAPDRSVLLVTGSPRAQSFSLVPGLDVLKLPSVLKRADGGYGARSLRLDLESATRLRAEILRAAALEFRPDVVLVDHAPTGFQGELEPLFESLTADPAAAPRFLLGLREIIDDAEAVRVQWTRENAWRRLDALYDRVLVYGDPRVLTTAAELGLGARLGERLVHTGYVARTPAPRPETSAPPLVLVTAGGGGDGQDLFRSYARYLESLAAPPAFRSLVVTGPFLSAERGAELRERFARVGGSVEVTEFVEDCDAVLARASAVVAMAGYNTAVECLAAGTPVLFLPREAPRREQSLRAERLAAVAPSVRFARAADATPDLYARFLREALATPRGAPCGLRLDGAAQAAAAIEAVACEPRRIAGAAASGVAGRRRA
jgi:predicted glycosyltransferase